MPISLGERRPRAYEATDGTEYACQGRPRLMFHEQHHCEEEIHTAGEGRSVADEGPEGFHSSPPSCSVRRCLADDTPAKKAWFMAALIRIR